MPILPTVSLSSSTITHSVYSNWSRTYLLKFNSHIFNKVLNILIKIHQAEPLKITSQHILLFHYGFSSLPLIPVYRFLHISALCPAMLLTRTRSQKLYNNSKGKGKVHPCTGTEALYRPYGPQEELRYSYTVS
jgi:hypothetical protein